MLQGNLTQQSTMSLLTIVELSRSQFAAIFIAAIVQVYTAFSPGLGAGNDKLSPSCLVEVVSAVFMHYTFLYGSIIPFALG